MRFENQISIEADRETVFDFVADQRNTPKWNYFILEVFQTRGEGPFEGAEYAQTRKTDSQRTAITHLARGERVIIETLEGRPIARRDMSFMDVDGATMLTDRWTVTTGYPRFLEVFTTGRVGRAVASNLAILKRLLEDGAVTLQDGRRVSLKD